MKSQALSLSITYNLDIAISMNIDEKRQEYKYDWLTPRWLNFYIRVPVHSKLAHAAQLQGDSYFSSILRIFLHFDLRILPRRNNGFFLPSEIYFLDT